MQTATSTASNMARRNRAENPDWRTTEIAILREHYPQGGALACHKLLPKRSMTAIAHKANSIGLRTTYHHARDIGAKFTPARQLPDNWQSILRAYASAGEYGWRRDAAAAVNRSPSWVSAQLRKMGLGQNHADWERTPWTEAELQLLEMHGHLSAERIQQIMAAQGIRRTQSAIASKLARLGLDRTDPDRWTLTELSRLCGVSSITTLRWADALGLKTTRHSHRPLSHRMTSRDDIKRWVIKTGARHLDLTRVNQVWLKEILWSSAT